jgi:hypothetical protein
MRRSKPTRPRGWHRPVLGIVIIAGSPRLVDNTIEDLSGRGITIALGASPSLSGNVVCGNGEDLWVAPGASPQLGDDGLADCAAPGPDAG